MIQVSNLTKIYKNDSTETLALEKISFQVAKGEFVTIMGPSGSGKSTLMHILGAMDTPTSGTYLLDGQEINKLSDDQLTKIRNQKIGFVFQAYNLLPRTTALKNVILPMIYARVSPQDRRQRAQKLLEDVGLGDKLNNLSNQLSGGQQQRVAIARSLANNPAIILADEPTGNLATVQGEEIMAIFQKLNAAGHTILMITHEPSIASHAQRVLTLKDGHLISDHKIKQKQIHK